MLTKRNFTIENALYIVLLAAALAVGLNQLMDIIDLASFSAGYNAVSLAQGSRSIWETVLFSCLLIPIIEEIVFRGFIFNRSRVKLGFIAAALLSSVLFGAYHMNLVQFVYAFLMGLVMCMLYECFGGIGAAILFHMTANTVVLLAGFIGILGRDPYRIISCAAGLLIGGFLLRIFIR